MIIRMNMQCASEDRNSHGSGISFATTASPKPSFRTPWRVGGAVVSRGNARWTTSKSGRTCLCQNFWQGPSTEKTWKGSQLNCPSCSPKFCGCFDIYPFSKTCWEGCSVLQSIGSCYLTVSDTWHTNFAGQGDRPGCTLVHSLMSVFAFLQLMLTTCSSATDLMPMHPWTCMTKRWKMQRKSSRCGQTGPKGSSVKGMPCMDLATMRMLS